MGNVGMICVKAERDEYEAHGSLRLNMHFDVHQSAHNHYKLIRLKSLIVLNGGS